MVAKPGLDYGSDHWIMDQIIELDYWIGSSELTIREAMMVKEMTCKVRLFQQCEM